jgi:hypothetical protein
MIKKCGKVKEWKNTLNERVMRYNKDKKEDNVF